MANKNSNYETIFSGLKEFESTINKLKSENEECENVDVILNSQIAGIIQESIKRDIESKNLSDSERESLLDEFDELKDYFADVQVDFELGCKCMKTTKEERMGIYERHARAILRRESQEYLEKARITAELQLLEREMRKHGR